jgi:hypothetical protein
MFCRLPGKKCRRRRDGAEDRELSRSLDIADAIVWDRMIAAETLLLRALTPVEIADAMVARMIGCNRPEAGARQFAPGNFFRINALTVSHFFCLSVARASIPTSR